jgi:hypothetical protein
MLTPLLARNVLVGNEILQGTFMEDRFAGIYSAT